MDEKLKNLRRQGTLLTPRFIIGKNGLTENTIKNIKNELKIEKLVKIRILATFLGDKNKDDIVKELAEKTESKIVQFIGFTVVLTRR